MRKEHYQSAATITAALIAERTANGMRTTQDEAVALYAELVLSLNQAVKDAVSKMGDPPD